MSTSSTAFIVDARRLRVLRELADRGTVTATAQAMHLTPSAVSQQLASLAREAGVPLLAKVGRGVALTSQARILLQHADIVHAQLERARRDLDAHADGLVGRVTIASFATAITGLVAPVVGRQRRLRSEVDLRVVEVEGDAAFTQLSTGEVDVVVSVEWPGSPLHNDPRFSRRVVLRDPMDVLLPAGHPLAARAGSLTLADLADQPWISGSSGTCYDVMLTACTSAGFAPDIHHRSGDWTAVAALVVAGCGVALVPRLGMATAPAGAVLGRLAAPQPVRTVFVATRSGAEDSPLLAPVLQALVAQGTALAASVAP